MARFQVQARVLDLLGEEQIADLPTAISELFKNAYDAFATRTALDVYRAERHLVFWDDGIGMSEQDVLNRWLVVGTPGKKIKSEHKIPSGKFARPVMGEKGIGRLAISRLGDTMLMVTKTARAASENPKGCYTALFINWNIVRNPRLLLDDIEIPVVTFSRIEELGEGVVTSMLEAFRRPLISAAGLESWAEFPNEHKRLMSQLDSFAPDIESLRRIALDVAESGTAFYIAHPKDDLDGNFFRDSVEFPDDEPRANEIIQLLANFSDTFTESDETLANPKSKRTTHDKFSVDIRLWRPGDRAPTSLFDERGSFGVDDLKTYDHFIDVTFDEFGRYQGVVQVYNEPQSLPTLADQPKERLACGPFAVRLWYWHGLENETLLNKVEFERINKKLMDFGGLMLYRSGLRVMPYGKQEFDWLRFEDRRGKHAGRNFFSYKRMFGYVSIDATANQDLRDKAGREGLISNSAYRAFVARLIKFFLEIARVHFDKSEHYRDTKEAITQQKETFLAARRKADDRRQELREKLKAAMVILRDTSSHLEGYRELFVHAAGESTATARDDFKRVDSALEGFESNLQRFERNARVTVPKDLAPGRDNELKRLIAEYAEVWKTAESAIGDTRRLITELAGSSWPDADRRRRTKIQFDQRFALAKMRVGKSFASIETQLKLATDKLQADLNDLKEQALRRIDGSVWNEHSGFESLEFLLDRPEMLPIVLNNLENETALIEIDAADLAERTERYVARFWVDAPDRLAAAQQGALEKMEEDLRTAAELAQVGLAVQIVEHDLGQVIHGLRTGITTLKVMLRSSERGTQEVEKLRGYFQHFEFQFQQLQPLYRRSNRVKIILSGQEIGDFLRGFMGHQLTASGTRFETTESFKNFQICESTSLLFPMFVNILDNAIYWMLRGEKRLIRMDYREGIITVCDSGPGIHESLLEDIFEPFVSTKPSGRGLGLYIARTTLSLAGHEIWATNSREFKLLTGACFCIRFSQESKSARTAEEES